MSEWYGIIPQHWGVQKINELFAERREKVSDKEYPPLSVSKGGTVPQIATVAKTNAGDNRKLVRKGDFAINSRSDRRGSSGISQYDGSVSLINIVLTPRKETNGKYWHYLLKSHYFVEEFYRNGRGIVADLWTTRYTEMKSIYLPVPPRSEQDQIVRFLDWKVSQINKYVKLLHGKASVDPKILETYPNSLLAYLFEYRTRLISDVVTGKLDVRGVVVPEFEAVEEAAAEDETQDEDEATDTEEE